MKQSPAGVLKSSKQSEALDPSISPSLSPTPEPTVNPTLISTIEQSIGPTIIPTINPTFRPSSDPTSFPSMSPSGQPSNLPSGYPTAQPTCTPTVKPFALPTNIPSNQPSSEPSTQPSVQPTILPTVQPISIPTAQPFALPTSVPSNQPSREPSTQPSVQPTSIPTLQPSAHPTSEPTRQPTSRPTAQPSSQPSRQPTTLPTSIAPILNLGHLISEQGISIMGEFVGGRSGWSVSGAGDFNSDGYDDVVMGSYSATTGVCYVIFGNSTLFNIDIANDLSIFQGFAIIGAIPGDLTGYSVSDAGDINGDKISDIIIGAPYWEEGDNTNQGISYIIYGKNSAFANIELLHLNEEQGFSIKGVNSNDRSGWSVSKAGDVNDDGHGDIIIGAPNANPISADTSTGASYIVFGKTKNVNVDLEYLLPGQGVLFVGTTNSMTGFFVSAAGDVNGDKIDDVIIGAPAADFENRIKAGISYVVFGSKNITNTIFLKNITESQQGFYIVGANSGDNSGSAVSEIGDFNKDGFADVIIGAPSANPYGILDAGNSYVVYGKNDTAIVDLASLTSDKGLPIYGSIANGNSGASVSGAGDVNKDGYADVIIGVPNANSVVQPNSIFEYKMNQVSRVDDIPQDGGQSNSGISYVVYGKGTTELPGILTLGSITYAEGYEIIGASNSAGGRSVSGAGDFNGDGFADVVIGAPELSSEIGASYVIVNADISAMPTAVPTIIPTAFPTHDNTLTSLTGWTLGLTIVCSIVGFIGFVGLSYLWYDRKFLQSKPDDGGTEFIAIARANVNPITAYLNGIAQSATAPTDIDSALSNIDSSSIASPGEILSSSAETVLGLTDPISNA